MTKRFIEVARDVELSETSEPTRDALYALERESDDVGDFGLDDELAFDDAPLDEIDLTIQEYLDGELSDEERAAFEARIANEPWLAKRVESSKSTFDVLDAFDEPVESESVAVDLTERTVDRLNQEAKAELAAIKARRDAVRRRGKALSIAAPILFLFIGYGVFAALTPDVERQRERDARVVERLMQLEAVDDFEYLKALADANLFESLRQTSPPNMAFGARNRENAALAEVRDRPYDELIKNSVFYRLQRRFEALDRETQDKYRELRRQIDESPEKEKLLQTLDDYSGWIVSSTSDADRRRLAASPIPTRIREIRRRVDDAQRFMDAFRSWQNGRRSGEQSGGGARNNGPGSSLRAALPPTLQRENFQSIYNKYVEFMSNPENNDGDSSRHDDVLDFLAATDQESLISDFSQESKDELNALDPAQRSSTLGLIVSLSFIENGRRFVQTRPFQDSESRSRRRGGSVQELGETLRETNPRARDYVTSLPPLEARGALMSLNWGVGNWNSFNVNSQNNPNNRNERNVDPSNRNRNPFGAGTPPFGGGFPGRFPPGGPGFNQVGAPSGPGNPPVGENGGS